jgi:hypothetical protein
MRIQALRSNGLSESTDRIPENLNALVRTGAKIPRQLVIGLILVFALLAFELFNFDTTRFALESLLGDVRFLNLTWAAILAVAFCAIDFAGLAKLFTPERGSDEPKEVWYLMGAWFLGATMNAVMTWWAVSLTLLGSQLGNEILSREEILRFVPVFVAALVWLTRILFIGALSVTGDRLLHGQKSKARSRQAPSKGSSSMPRRSPVFSGAQNAAIPTLTPQPVDLAAAPAESKIKGKIRRPSRPISSYNNRPAARGVQASGRGQNSQR